MKKILTIAIIAVIAAGALAGCGAKEADVHELSEALVQGGQFSEPLYSLDEEVTLKRYNIDEAVVEECEASAGTRAVVDEVLVIKTTDTDQVQQKIREHVDSQRESYSSYRPEEVPKLDDAVIYTYNDVVILCVSEDSEMARSIIVDYTTK